MQRTGFMKYKWKLEPSCPTCIENKRVEITHSLRQSAKREWRKPEDIKVPERFEFHKSKPFH